MDREFLKTIVAGTVVVMCNQGGVVSKVKLAAYLGKEDNLKLSASASFAEADKITIFPPGTACEASQVSDLLDGDT